MARSLIFWLDSSTLNSLTDTYVNISYRMLMARSLIFWLDSSTLNSLTDTYVNISYRMLMARSLIFWLDSSTLNCACLIFFLCSSVLLRVSMLMSRLSWDWRSVPSILSRIRVLDRMLVTVKEGNVLFNDALNTFYLWLYGRKEGRKCFI